MMCNKDAAAMKAVTEAAVMPAPAPFEVAGIFAVEKMPAKAPEAAEAPAKAPAAAVVAPPETRQPNDAASDAPHFDPDDDSSPEPQPMSPSRWLGLKAYKPQSIGWRGSSTDNLE